MKKNLIAGAGVVAALGVAALPVATFAGSTSYTETVTATINPTCGMVTGDAGSDAGDIEVKLGTLSNGANGSASGQTVKIICNDGDGWSLSAVGAGTAKNDVTKMDSSTNSDEDDITTGTSTASYWNFQIASVGGNIVEGFDKPQNIPATETAIVSTTGPTDSATVTPTYNIKLSSTQAAATYTGKVTYKLANN